MSRTDLAEADAAILVQPGKWDGATPPLTSADALTMADIAALASKMTGREVRHVTASDAEMLLETLLAARRGRSATC